MANLNTMDTTFGSAFIGLVCSAVMYGLTLLQTYTYYRRYPNDNWKLKCLVFVLWILDTLHLVLCTVALYWYLVKNFNNPDALTRNHWSINLQTDCNGVIGISVEAFFAFRVWKISGNWFLTCLILVLATLHFGLGVLFTVEAFMFKEFSKYSKLTWVTSLGLGSAAAADIIIAASLCYFLHRNRTGFRRTDNLISTLMLYAINTGLLTSICASAAVISFATMPLNFIWLSFFWVLGKFYVNSLLATLNSREALREKAMPAEGTFVQLSNFREVGTESILSRQGYRHGHPSGTMGPPVLAVTVQTTKEQRSDYLNSPTRIDEEPESAVSAKSSTAFLPSTRPSSLALPSSPTSSKRPFAF